jgi:hypothetical protein
LTGNYPFGSVLYSEKIKFEKINSAILRNEDLFLFAPDDRDDEENIFHSARWCCGQIPPDGAAVRLNITQRLRPSIRGEKSNITPNFSAEIRQN